MNKCDHSKIFNIKKGNRDQKMIWKQVKTLVVVLKLATGIKSIETSYKVIVVFGVEQDC